MNKPLEPEEYSLANEARLLRRLIDEAPSAQLKQSLVTVLLKTLYQDEERALRNHETLTAGAVHEYVGEVIKALVAVLRAELPDEQMYKIVDLITEKLAALRPPRNSPADLKLLK
ncbi:hypothetical protein [Lacipirellula sp.]|uniref:hypothetical protein n=1 Tax=Lacipirellula sp. TaxID=2691419 RepID=UPI003D10FB8D